MAKVYKVSFTLTLADEASHPRKWVADTIGQGLEAGEAAEDYEFEEVEAPESQLTK